LPGWNHSEEARKKIAKSQYVPVVHVDAEGNELATYASMQEAAKAVGANFPNRNLKSL
jgi:hypothetical protein